MQFRNYRFIITVGVVMVCAKASMAAYGDGWIVTPQGAFDKDGNPMDTKAMRHVSGEDYTRARSELDQLLEKVRKCQPTLADKLTAAEKALLAYDTSMQELFFPDANSKSGTIYPQQRMYLSTQILHQHIALLKPKVSGDQASWCTQ